MSSVIEDLKELTKDYNINDYFKRVCPGGCINKKGRGHEAMLGRNFKIYCPKCKKHYDVIDVLKILNNVDDLGLKRLLLSNKAEIAPVNKKKFDRDKAAHLKKETERERINRIIKEMTLKNSIPLTNNCLNYLKNRGLGNVLELIDKNVLELKTNKYNGQEYIIYVLKKQKNAIQKNIVKDEDKKRFVKNLGDVAPFFHRSYPNNNVLICEGIEDALSALLYKKNFLCLNSVSNINKLIASVKKNPVAYKKYRFELCLDTDTIGKENMIVLENLFKEQKIDYYISDLFVNMQNLNVKDLNNLLIYKCSKNKETKEI